MGDAIFMLANPLEATSFYFSTSKLFKNMESVKVDELADQGAGDAIPSLKIADLVHKATSPEIHSVDDPEELPSTIVATDSGFTESPSTIPICVHQCGQCPSLPTFQSDCLKVCTWLRVTDALFQISNHKLNLDGRFPTIQIADTQISNSSQILAEMASQFNRDLDADLTVEQNILAFSLGSLIEHILAREHREWYRTNRGKLLRAYDIDLKKSWKTSFPNAILEFIFKKSVWKKSSSSPITAAESMAVLGTLSRLLASKRYFFGEDIVSSLDVVAFAVLVPILAISERVRYNSRDAIKQNFSNLVAFVEHMKERFYPDWKELCSGDSSEADREILERSIQELANVALNSEMQSLPTETAGRSETMETEV